MQNLGVTIDQHLSRKSNTENICKKVTAGISAIPSDQTIC
jgi:hypothetical protein